MTAPSPYDVAMATSNNIGKAQQRQTDISAIDQILMRANQSGNPQDVDMAMSQILQRVSPERQQGALALLQKKQSDLMQTKENTALKKYGIDLTDIYDPGLRQQFATTGYQQNIAMEKAKNSSQVNYNRPSSQPINKTTVPTNQAPASGINQVQQGVQAGKNQLPLHSQATIPNLTTQGSGNAPVNATTGQIEPVLDVNQLFEEGKRIAAEERAQGNAVTDQQGFDIANAVNNARITHNANVEAERSSRRESQKDYGDIATNAVGKYFPQGTASPKIEAMFQKKAEEYAAGNDSEAQIKAKLFKDAKDLKDAISNIESSPKPKRAWTKAAQKSLGTGREAENEERAIRNKLKPLLEMGLYDESRVALAKTGRYPEEIESLVTSQGENTKRVLAEFIPIKKVKAPQKEAFSPVDPYEIISNIGKPWQVFVPKEIYKPQDIQNFGQNLGATLQNDPSTNLILLRKAYEDKGVDWRLFKDELDRIVDEGLFAMNPEQKNQYDRLDEPPLDGLDKILFDFNLKGR